MSEAANTDKADFAPPRASDRHTKAVRRWRIVLPLIALFIVGIILIWPEFSDGPGELSVSDVTVESSTINMINPRYRGTTQKGEPYTIQADAARQTTQDRALVELDHIRAALDANDGRLELSAPSGRYHTQNEMLALDGPVHLASAQGYEIKTGDLAYDVGKGEGGSDQPIEAKGPMGEIRADRFAMTGEAADFLFSGNVRLVYYGEATP